MAFLGYEDTLKELGISNDELKDLVKSGKLQPFSTGTDASGKKQIGFRREDVQSLSAPQTLPGATESADDFDIDISDDEAVAQPDEDIDFDLDASEAGHADIESQPELGLEDGGTEESDLELENFDSVEETLTLGVDGDEDSLSLNDSELTIDGETEMTDEDEEEEDLPPPPPVTKIIDEPSVGVVMPLFSLFSFGIIAFIGFLVFAMVFLDQGQSAMDATEPSFYDSITDFVKKNFPFPK